MVTLTAAFCLLCSLYQDDQEQVWGRWWHRHERHRKISTSSSLRKSDFFPLFKKRVLVFFNTLQAVLLGSNSIHLLSNTAPWWYNCWFTGALKKTWRRCSKKKNTENTENKYSCFIKKIYLGHKKTIILHWYSTKKCKMKNSKVMLDVWHLVAWYQNYTISSF